MLRRPRVVVQIRCNQKRNIDSSSYEPTSRGGSRSRDLARPAKVAPDRIHQGFSGAAGKTLFLANTDAG